MASFSDTTIPNDDNPINRIISILDLPAATYEKELLSYLKGLGYQGVITLCECGYPVEITYKDGSSGPIMPILDSEETHDPYTFIYKCPRCRAYVAKITT